MEELGTLPWHHFLILPFEARSHDVDLKTNSQEHLHGTKHADSHFECLGFGKPVFAPRARGIQDYFAQAELIYFNRGDSEDLANKFKFVFPSSERSRGNRRAKPVNIPNYICSREKANLLSVCRGGLNLRRLARANL